MQQADRGISELMESVDTTIVIPNEKLLAVAEDAGFFESFRIADDILRQGVQGISDIITIPGIINRDFADVKTIMAGMGYAVMGTASASGAQAHHRSRAKSHRLASARSRSDRRRSRHSHQHHRLVFAEAGRSAASLRASFRSAAHEDANIIFGAVMDEKMKDAVKITVIATGFKECVRRKPHAHETRTGFVVTSEMPSVASRSEKEEDEFFKRDESRDSNRPMVMQDADAREEIASVETASPAPQSHAEVIAMDASRDAHLHEAVIRESMMANFNPQDDLDVPAFMRKRNETM